MTYSTATDRTVDEIAIRARERDYDAAWTAGDIVRVLAAFTPDAVVISPYGRALHGVVEIGTALRSFLSGEAAGTTHASKVTAVHFVTADVALVDGEATIQSAAQPDGVFAQPLTHSFTDVFVKREGTWLISHVRAYTFLRQPAAN
jgi:uncharacterized protein (TIGR02246 family)